MPTMPSRGVLLLVILGLAVLASGVSAKDDTAADIAAYVKKVAFGVGKVAEASAGAGKAAAVAKHLKPLYAKDVVFTLTNLPPSPPITEWVGNSDPKFTELFEKFSTVAPVTINITNLFIIDRKHAVYKSNVFSSLLGPSPFNAATSYIVRGRNNKWVTQLISIIPR